MSLIRNVLMMAVVLATAAVATPSFAADAEKAIKARKAQMVLYSWNLGMLGAMAKGKVPYDAKAASAAANNLLALSMTSQDAMWPQGSDSTAMPGKTRAKLEGWTTYPAVAEKDKAFRDATSAMAAVAGNGLDALKGTIGAVGKSCGGCHKPFRDPKK